MEDYQQRFDVKPKEADVRHEIKENLKHPKRQLHSRKILHMPQFYNDYDHYGH